MATTLQKTLASTLLAAAAFTGTAEAQSRRGEDPAEAKERIQACYQVGQAKGVDKLPLTNKAYQQDRTSLVACTYNVAAGGELIVSEAYDLGDPRKAQEYSRDVSKLQRDETKEQNKLARQGGKVDENGNVVRDAAKETTSTIKDAKKTVDSVTQGVNAIDKLGKSLKNFGF